jgi:hypothetical protein
MNYITKNYLITVTTTQAVQTKFLKMLQWFIDMITETTTKHILVKEVQDVVETKMPEMRK